MANSLSSLHVNRSCCSITPDDAAQEDAAALRESKLDDYAASREAELAFRFHAPALSGPSRPPTNNTTHIGAVMAQVDHAFTTPPTTASGDDAAAPSA